MGGQSVRRRVGEEVGSPGQENRKSSARQSRPRKRPRTAPEYPNVPWYVHAPGLAGLQHVHAAGNAHRIPVDEYLYRAVVLRSLRLRGEPSRLWGTTSSSAADELQTALEALHFRGDENSLVDRGRASVYRLCVRSSSVRLSTRTSHSPCTRVQLKNQTIFYSAERRPFKGL